MPNLRGTGPLRSSSLTRQALLLLMVLVVAAPSANGHDDPASELVKISAQIALHPDDPALYLHRAELHRARREWSEGVSDLQTASRLDSNLIALDLALAGLLREAGNPEPALEAIDRYLLRRPELPGAHLLRARILVLLGRKPEAIEEFTLGIDLAVAGKRAAQPDDYLDRARLQAAPGGANVETAIQGLDQGAAALHGAITLQLLAVELEVERRNWDSALACLAEIEANSTRKESWLARRGDVLVKADRPQEARLVYREALAAIDTLPARSRQIRATVNLAAQIREHLSAIDAAAN